MLNRVLEGCDQALILGEIVGLVAKVLAEMSDLASGLILDHHAVACGAGVAARAAVTVCDQIVLRGIFAVGVLTMRKKRFSSGAAGRRHVLEFTSVITGEDARVTLASAAG